MRTRLPRRAGMRTPEGGRAFRCGRGIDLSHVDPSSWELGRDKLKKHVPQNQSVRSDVGHALACPANGDRITANSKSSGVRSLGAAGRSACATSASGGRFSGADRGADGAPGDLLAP
jgi:hypothetical protein